MIVSCIQLSDSVIHICVSILFQILFLFGLLPIHNIDLSPLRYIVGLC